MRAFTIPIAMSSFALASSPFVSTAAEMQMPGSNGETVVEVRRIHSPSRVAQPAHVHTGTRAKLVAIPMAVNARRSADVLEDYVACADISAS